MSWRDKFYEFIAEWLRSKDYDVKEVTDVEEESWEPGGCPTCNGGIEYTIGVYWTDSDDEGHSERFSGKLSDLFW